MATARDEIRAELRRRRSRLCSEDARILSRAIWLQLFSLDAYRRAQHVLVYVGALGNEVHTNGILEEALGRGAHVYIPIVRRREKRLEVARLQDPADLLPGEFGIPELALEKQVLVEPGVLDMAIVPGLAFDRRGDRLGFGQGYFDRFLGGLSLTRIGLAYAFQIVPDVPREAWDVQMDFVVTEAGAIDCNAEREASGPASRS